MTAGVIALGAIGVRAFSFGSLSLGIFVLARLAPRGSAGIWPRDPGAPAIGPYLYGRSIAFGYREASVKQKESLFG